MTDESLKPINHNNHQCKSSDVNAGDEFLTYLDTNTVAMHVWKWASQEMDTRHDMSHGAWHIFQVALNVYRCRHYFSLNDEELHDAILCAFLHDTCDRKLITKTKDIHRRDVYKMLETCFKSCIADNNIPYHYINYIIDISTEISYTRWSGGLTSPKLLDNPVYLSVQFSDSLEQLGTNCIFRIGLITGQEYVRSDEKYTICGSMTEPISTLYFLGNGGKSERVGKFLLEKYEKYPLALKEIEHHLDVLKQFYNNSLATYEKICTL